MSEPQLVRSSVVQAGDRGKQSASRQNANNILTSVSQLTARFTARPTHEAGPVKLPDVTDRCTMVTAFVVAATDLWNSL
jgi:hypothetical protein